MQIKSVSEAEEITNLLSKIRKPNLTIYPDIAQ